MSAPIKVRAYLEDGLYRVSVEHPDCMPKVAQSFDTFATAWMYAVAWAEGYRAAMDEVRLSLEEAPGVHVSTAEEPHV